MPQRHKRSRSLRKVKVKLSGKKTVTHYRRKNPKAAKCSSCKSVLKGAPRLRPYKMHKLPKSKKRPERPYGGNLCSKCMRTLFVEKARIN